MLRRFWISLLLVLALVTGVYADWLPGNVRLFTGMTAAPAVTDDMNSGYQIGDVWVDETNDNSYQCQDTTVGAAVWVQIDGAGGGGGGAPTDADYLVGTANGSLSAEIVVGVTPGGELGGTWGSPTIDDSVTVTGWVLGASTATSPAANDNDTSLATTLWCETTQDYLKTSENNDSADAVSIGDVQTACTNDFHNIGGTDDDVPELGDFAAANDLDANGDVDNDSHAHTTTTVSGLDISADTNLAVTANQIVLTDDTLSLALNKDIVATSPLTVNGGTNLDDVLIGADSDVTFALGTVGVANGGSGKTSWTQWLIPYADTTTSFSQVAIGTSGQVLTSNGAGAAPTFQAAAGGSSSLPLGYVSGLVPSNHTDTDHDISISAGKARDSTDAVDMTLASAIVKQIDAAWAVGTAAGGLDGTESVGGTPDASTIYNIFLIKRSDTGVVDVCYSENAPATGPSRDATPIPVAYDYWRWLGWVVTNGSANITLGDWVGGSDGLTFWFKARYSLATGLTQTSYTTQATTGAIPSGITSEALFGGTTTANTADIYLSSDGTNAKTIFKGSNLDNAIGSQNELYHDGWASPIPIPIVGDQVYYKISGNTLALYLRAVRYWR